MNCISSKQRYQETKSCRYSTHYAEPERTISLIIALLLINHWMLCEFLKSRKVKKSRKRLHSLAFCNNLKVQTDVLLRSSQSSDNTDYIIDLRIDGICQSILTSDEDCFSTDVVKSNSGAACKENIYEKWIEKQNGISKAIPSNNGGPRYTSYVRYRTVVFSLSHVVSSIIHSLDSSNLFLLDTVIRTSVCVNYDLSTVKRLRIPPPMEYDGYCVLLTETTISQSKKKPYKVSSGIRNVTQNKFLRVTNCATRKNTCNGVLNVDCLLISHLTDKMRHDDGGCTLKVGYPAVCNYHPMAHSSALDGKSMIYFDPVVAACKAWRWPDLKSGEWLRRLPFCRSKSLGLQRRICINPYHLNRVMTGTSLKVTSGACKLTHPMEPWSLDPDLVSVGLNVYEENVASDVQSSAETTPAASNVCDTQIDNISRCTTKTPLRSPVDEFDKISSNRPLLCDQCEPSLSSASTESTFLHDDVSKSIHLSSYTYSSSLSSNPEESSSEGQKAKKPRSCPSTVACDHRGMQILVDRAWASLSYWEGHRHVGVSWHKLNCRTIRICYDDETEGGCTSWDQGKQYSIKAICLSRLLDGWTANHRSAGTHALTYPKSPYPHIPTGGTRNGACPGDVSTSPFISRLLSVQMHSRMSSDRHRSLCSRRLCSRLGRQGVSLTVTPLGQVWLNNQSLQSNMPVFVSSPCLFHEDGQKQAADTDRPVFRVPAGFSLLVFDRAVYSTEVDMPTGSTNHESVCSMAALPERVYPSPCQPPCPVVHISLGKGWGPRYRRPDVTHCPARLELWVNVDFWCMPMSSRAPE